MTSQHDKYDPSPVSIGRNAEPPSDDERLSMLSLRQRQLVAGINAAQIIDNRKWLIGELRESFAIGFAQGFITPEARLFANKLVQQADDALILSCIGVNARLVGRPRTAEIDALNVTTAFRFALETGGSEATALVFAYNAKHGEGSHERDSNLFHTVNEPRIAAKQSVAQQRMTAIRKLLRHAEINLMPLKSPGRPPGKIGSEK